MFFSTSPLPFCRQLIIRRLKVAKPGLYANIHAKRKRIKAGSDETMRKKGAKGAPSSKDFEDSAKTAKAMYGGTMKKNMKVGGEAKVLPNEGLTALNKVAPGVVTDMGYMKGGNVCKTRKAMSYGGKMKSYASEDKKYGGSANMPNPRKPQGTM